MSPSVKTVDDDDDDPERKKSISVLKFIVKNMFVVWMGKLNVLFLFLIFSLISADPGGNNEWDDRPVVWLIIIDENWLKQNPIVFTLHRPQQIEPVCVVWGIPLLVMNVCEDSEDLGVKIRGNTRGGDVTGTGVIHKQLLETKKTDW